MPLKVSDGIEAWIKDFQKSDAPQFKGKDKEERRDMAVAAYLSAKRGPLKDERVRQEAQTAKQKADMDAAIAAFKAKGGKIKKLPPGKAAGYHGKDDPGKDIAGILKTRDTRGIGTRKKARSMRAGYNMGESVILENAKLKKIKQLGMLGLVDRSDVQRLMNAMKAMDAGKEVPKNQRAVIFDAFNSLIDLVTGDTTVFQKAKKSVKEEYQFDEAVNYRFVAIDRVGKVIGFASKESDAKDMARRNRGKVVALKKPMSPKKGDMMVNRPFKEAVDPSDTGGAEETSMAMKQVKAMRHFLDGIEMRVKSTGDMEEWYQNKLTKANDYLKTLYSYGKGDSTNEAVDDDTLRMYADNPKMIKTGQFRRLKPQVQKAVKTHLKALGKLK